jgi:hypothetical protein
MVALEDVPGLDVQIAVNGEILREYQDRDAKVSDKTIERYVEAESNANFEIRYSFKQPFPADRTVSMMVTIDGKDLDEPIIRPYELFEAKGHASRGPISRVGDGWVVQPYCFAPIDISKSFRMPASDQFSDIRQESAARQPSAICPRISCRLSASSLAASTSSTTQSTTQSSMVRLRS